MKIIQHLVLSSLISAAACSANTPSPDPAEVGTESVSTAIEHTLPPTIDVVARQGRGTPTAVPTPRPTFDPTEQGYGQDVQIALPKHLVAGAGEGTPADGPRESAVAAATGAQYEEPTSAAVEMAPRWTAAFASAVIGGCIWSILDGFQ